MSEWYVITTPAEGPVPNGDGQSAGMVVTTLFNGNNETSIRVFANSGRHVVPKAVFLVDIL